MTRTATVLVVYGLFLVLMGVTGFLSNPEKAKTALLSGGLFGGLNVLLGWLSSGRWSAAPTVALGLGVCLSAVFTWRTIVTWKAHLDGTPDKLTAACLITAMLVSTVAVVIFLLWSRRSPTRARMPISG
jgi:hypothetical protein